MGPEASSAVDDDDWVELRPVSCAWAVDMSRLRISERCSREYFILRLVLKIDCIDWNVLLVRVSGQAGTYFM